MNLVSRVAEQPLGIAAVVVAVSCGAYAVTVAPANSVDSTSIRDHAVATADLHAGSVIRAKLATNLSGVDVRDGSLTGAEFTPLSVGSGDVADGSLTAADFAGGDLGTVPAALLAGHVAVNTSGSCDPDTSAYVSCAPVTVHLDRPARLLLEGQVIAASESGGYGFSGSCGLRVDGYPVFASSPMPILTDYRTDEAVGLVGVSDPLSAGDHVASVYCDDTHNTTYTYARILAITAGTS